MVHVSYWVSRLSRIANQSDMSHMRDTKRTWKLLRLAMSRIGNISDQFRRQYASDNCVVQKGLSGERARKILVSLHEKRAMRSA